MGFEPAQNLGAEKGGVDIHGSSVVCFLNFPKFCVGSCDAHQLFCVPFKDVTVCGSGDQQQRD